MQKQIHIPILKSFDELKFNIGKKSLVDFIKGDPNDSIDRNKLDELNSFGCLYMEDKLLIENVIDDLIIKKYLEYKILNGGFRVVSRTIKGGQEIYKKEYEFKLNENTKKQLDLKDLFNETKIDIEDKKIFKVFDFFLKDYNDLQKKAIINENKHILCVAGAGSGKTTVLTKRIEFLNKFKGVNQKKILAITFTRKAKEEMKSRLISLGLDEVYVETFNSFCEKVLRKRGNLIYGDKITRIATFKDKIQIIRNGFLKLSIKFEILIDDYFTKKQIREKNIDELFFLFVRDVFSIVDFYKNLDENVDEFYNRETKSKERRIAKIVYDLVIYTQNELKKKGLRDFSDQIIDTLNLYKNNTNLIPKFEHILIDEYQDLNLVQFEFIKLLIFKNNKNNLIESTPSLFAVGDPRQAIYGWRGSNIKFILDFPTNFENTSIISLKKNYRSYPQIVNLINKTIKDMGLIDLESNILEDNQDRVFIKQFSSELLERVFIVEAIKNSKNNRNEIFILARTNKILENFVDILKQNGISYVIKSEDERKVNIEKISQNDVILATVHSIKGMEAKEVYVVSSNSASFPNKAQDNFILELVKEDNNYDKYAEEQRLFYVALSRAKEKLIITYTGNLTKFIEKEGVSSIKIENNSKNLFDYSTKYKINDKFENNSSVIKNMLKDWRQEKSQNLNLPLYMIISNSAIDEICMFKPQSKSELYNIKGLGEIKIAKYGNEILKLVSNLG